MNATKRSHATIFAVVFGILVLTVSGIGSIHLPVSIFQVGRIVYNAGTILNGFQYDLKVNQSGGLCYAWFANNSLFQANPYSYSLISSIVSYLDTTGGGIVYFENGSYTSFEPWRITVPHITLIAERGTIVDFSVNPKVPAYGIGVFADDVTVRGFVIQNRGAGIHAFDTEQTYLENNTILNSWTGIILESCNNSQVISNTISLTQGDGIYITIDNVTNGTSSNIVVNYNTLLNIGDTGIDFSEGSGHSTFYNAVVHHNVAYGYNAYTVSTWAYPGFVSVCTEVYGFSIINNTSYNGQNGIYIGGNNGIARDNHVKDFVMYPYLIYDTHNFTHGSGMSICGNNDAITNNTLIASNSSPLPLYDITIGSAENVVIDSNNLFGSFICGIYNVRGINRITVTKNAIFSQDANSIWGIQAGRQVWDIENNRLTVNGKEGNAAINAPYCTVLNNIGYS